MYKPKTLSEFLGNKKAIEELKKAILNWKRGNSPLLLAGPTGIGKNLALELISEELGLELIEKNASDYRNVEALESVVESLKQASLFKKGKVLVIDEAEAFTRKDRGGLSELIKMSKNSSYPVVFITSDLYNQKIKSLKQTCHLIKMSKVNYISILSLLKRICDDAGVKYDETALRSLARQSSGDVRSALLDLLILMTKDRITSRDIEDVSFRNRQENVFNTLRIIFKTMTVETSVRSVSNLDKRPEELIWWIETNLSKEYYGKDLATAFDNLSKADIFLNRIIKRQNWSLLKYYIDMVSAGISLSKSKPNPGYVAYHSPGRFVFRKEEVLGLDELSKQLHCSKSKVMNDYKFLVEVIASKEQR